MMKPFRGLKLLWPVNTLSKVAIALVFAVFLSGCYEVTEADQKLVIRYSAQVRVLVVIVPAAVTLGAGALYLIMRNSRTLIIGGAGALGLLVVFSSPIFVEKVTVTAHFTRQEAGWSYPWTYPRFEVFRYEHVEHIGIMAKRWDVYHRNGNVQEIDPGYLWNENESLIKVKLQEYGVAFR